MGLRVSGPSLLIRDIDTCERFDQRRFPVIDVARRSYDKVRHKRLWTSGRGSPITLK